jgi:hypothetical protein
MSLVKRSVGKLSCAIVGHDISEDAEDRLYIKPKNKNGDREIDTICLRCNKKVHLKVDPTDEDTYFVTEIDE